MTVANQDFSIVQGNAGIVVWTITDGNDNPIPIGSGNVTAASLVVQQNLDTGTPVALTKTLTTGLSIVGSGSTGQMQCTFVAADTASMSEGYYYTLSITDMTGAVSTVATGQMTVSPKPLATSTGDPATTARDFARALVGDTDTDSPYFSDQVYNGLATTFGGPLYVAAQVCRMLGQKYAGKATKRLGDLSINYGEISKNFFNAADDYQAQADMHGGGMYTAGISKSDRNAYSPRFNSDAIGAFTTLKKFDNRGGSYGGFQNNNVPEDSA